MFPCCILVRMSKLSTQYVCQQCGYVSAKWLGQCPNCGSWNTLVETVVSTSRTQRTERSTQEKIEPVRLSEVKKEEYAKRISTGIGELDRVLGGGIIPGMVTLIAGEPGIGKSTLLLQIADGLQTIEEESKQTLDRLRREVQPGNKKAVGRRWTGDSQTDSNQSTVVYVAGEESATQIANRANRLGVKSTRIVVIEETDTDVVIEHLSKLENNTRISLVIIDSIQTMTTGDLTGTAGSVGQVRECAARLTSWAKRKHVPVFIVGHVTKEGTIAGPRVLEHMVDTVLWFEGERSEFLRVIRAVKNRFGATDEVGIFAMEERGLKEVANPAEIFIGKNTTVSGSVVAVTLEGNRPMLVEVQALVAPTKLAFPKRSASGVDSRRLEILTAVLTRRVGLPLWDYDIFVNAAGGLKVTEPAADLAIALAIASSFADRPLPRGAFAFGEIGLLGEVRDVLQHERRVKEARRLGYKLNITNKEAGTVREAIKKFVSSK